MIVYDTNLYCIDGGRLLSLRGIPQQHFYTDNNTEFRVIGVQQKTRRYDSLNMKPIEFDGVCVFNPNEDRVNITVILIGYWKNELGPLKGMKLVEKFCEDHQIDAGAWQWAEL